MARKLLNIIIILSLFSIGLPAQNNTLYQKAIEAKANKQFKKAAVLFEKYLSKKDTVNPSHETLTTMSNLAEVYRMLRDIDSTIKMADKIIAKANDTLDYEAKHLAYELKANSYFLNKNKFDAQKQTLLASARLSKINNNIAHEFSAYESIAFSYRSTDPDSCLHYLEILKPLAQTKNQLRIYHNLKGNIFIAISADSARYHYLQSIKYAEQMDDSVKISIAYRDYSSFLASMAEFELAVESSVKALNYINDPNSGTFLKIGILTNVTEIYKELSDFNKAEEYILQAKTLAEDKGYKIRNTEVARIYGEVLFGQKRFEESIIELEKAKEAYRQSKNAAFRLGTISALSHAYFKNNQLEKAFEHLNIVDQEIKELKSLPKLNLRHQMQSGIIYKESRKLNLSAQHFEKAKSLANEINQPISLMKICAFLGNVYEELNKPKLAALNYKEAFELREKSFKNDMIENTKKIEAIYKKAKQDKEIIQLNADNKTQEIALKQKSNLLIVGGIALGIISLLTFFILGLYRKVKQKNSIIATALEEKDILLREIHHRVKNNLQVISSLLSLQSRQIADKDIKQAINEGRSRVRSMALIHQNLYQNENMTGVSVDEYINKLTEELFDTYNITEGRIKLTKSIQDIELDVESMVPLGLIINELVSNALKHAFPNDKNGILHVSLVEEDNRILLTIQDNGIGTTLEEVNASNSFGNRLLKAFSSKLDADISINKNNGTKVCVTVKRYKKAA